MQHSVLTPSPVAAPRYRARRLAALAVAAGVAAVLAMLTVVAVQAHFAPFTLPAPPAGAATTTGSGSGAAAPGGDLASTDGRPLLLTEEDGHIPEGTVVTFADTHLPAIARLDPALVDAMRRAETDAAADGIPSFQVTSGWRSDAYQRWLLEDAIARYGREEIARQFVATPDRSQHVTGDAVDIVPLDAQLWLIEHGARYGICQTYANERWHFELATEPGGVCPEMKMDATA